MMMRLLLHNTNLEAKSYSTSWLQLAQVAAGHSEQTRTGSPGTESEKKYQSFEPSFQDDSGPSPHLSKPGLRVSPDSGPRFIK
jgi:hypothetical protein